jgi:ribosomal protein S12 methylthiotransferase
VREAESLAAAGAREITLIGQDTTSYGEDLGLREGLALLLERLSEIEELLWVRFLYAYPNRVTQKLLDTLAAQPRLAKYMDMPLQHASRNVLARMKRGSSGDAFLKLIERIRATIPGVSLRTSFIVGFPGESKRDFEELCAFVRAAEFDWMGVFEYSDVDTASSARLDEKIDAETIAERRNRLMAIQKKISKNKLRSLRGRTLTALVEGPSKDNPMVWEARIEGMAPDVDGNLYLTNTEANGTQAQPGDAARVEITETSEYDLIGSVVDILPQPRARENLMHLPAGPLQRIATGAPLRVLG